MIQNNTNTTSPATGDATAAQRPLASRPLAAHSWVLLLGLGLVAGCGDDGGDPMFPEDSGADASVDASTTSEETTSSEATSSTTSDLTTSIAPTTAQESSTNPSSSATSGTTSDSIVTDTSSGSGTESTQSSSGETIASSDSDSSSDSSSTETSTSNGTVELDGGADASDASTTDSTESTVPDASDTDTSDTDTSTPDAADASTVDTSETTEPSTDASTATDEPDAAPPVLLSGIGPTMPSPPVDLAGGGGNITDAVFTATITAPITKLVLINTDVDGDSYFIDTGGGGGYHTYWTTSNPIPSEVPPGDLGQTEYNIHTVNAETDTALPMPVDGADDQVTLDMYVSFDGNPLLTDFYRLYVFGENGVLTQIVDFAPTPDAGTDTDTNTDADSGSDASVDAN
jgi:hypothetical protein